MVELPQHPWFFGCQFHPEFTSNPRRGHPLFVSFVRAALDARAARPGPPPAPSPSSSPEADRPSVKLCGYDVGLDASVLPDRGPCVVESRQLQMDVAGELKSICADLEIPFVFKSSYDKANRSSHASYRGPGMDEGLAMLAEVRRNVEVPVLTDVHAEDEIAAAAAVVDVLQTPAFLCRQTDFIQAVASAGKPVNIKKGQFLAPEDMKQVVGKARAASGADNVMVCERGVSFGYHNLVSDMRALAIMRNTGLPGRVRRNALGATAGRQGHRIRAASASSSRCWRGPRLPPASRALHGNASGPGQGAVRRSQRVAAVADARTARDAEGTGCRRQARRAFPENELMASH